MISVGNAIGQGKVSLKPKVEGTRYIYTATQMSYLIYKLRKGEEAEIIFRKCDSLSNNKDSLVLGYKGLLKIKEQKVSELINQIESHKRITSEQKELIELERRLGVRKGVRGFKRGLIVGVLSGVICTTLLIVK